MFVENDRMERKLPIEHSRLHVGNLKIFLFYNTKKMLKIVEKEFPQDSSRENIQKSYERISATELC